MAKALTNMTKEGKAYVRPPAIEAGIDEALAQDLETILRRAKIRDRKDPEYLPSECLLHLIRDARMSGNKRKVDRLLKPLLSRCEGLLKWALPDGGRADADELRGEVMGRLCEMIARVGTNHDTRPLDFFEIRFNKALTTLRYKVVAAADRKRKHLKEVTPAEDENEEALEEDTCLARLSAAARTPAHQEDFLFLKEVSKVMKDTCTPEEQEAVRLCYLEQKTQEEAARICGVKDRTIRNWLAKAAQKIKKGIES